MALAEKYLLELESKSDADTLNALFRTVHSVKGAAGFFELKSIAQTAHVAETLLGKLRDGSIGVDSSLIEYLLASIDAIKDMIESPTLGVGTDTSALVSRGEAMLRQYAGNGSSNKQGTATASLSSPDLSRYKEYLLPGKFVYVIHLRVGDPQQDFTSYCSETSSMLQTLGEILATETDNATAGQATRLIFRTVIAPDIFVDSLSIPAECILPVPASVAQAPPAPEVIKPSIAPTTIPVSSPSPHPAPAKSVVTSAPTIRLGVDVLDKLLDHIGEVVLGRNQFSAFHQDDPEFLSLSQSITKLHQFVIQTRMQPIGSLFERYTRTVRDLSGKLGKKVELHLEGEDIGLDRTILESLSDPLTHMIRNSIDHGIETAEERSAKGKSVVGNLYLRAVHESGQILIEVEDDGKGIDPAMLRKKLVEKGLLGPAEAEQCSDKQIIDYIFHPGFSTKDSATELSGRGVGMDVVKSNLEKIGCSVEVISSINKGTLMSARIPLTMAVVNSSVISALIISISDFTLAIPQLAVNEVIRLTPQEQAQRIERVKGAEVFKLRDKIIPLIHLEDLLGIERSYFDPLSKRIGRDKRAFIVSEDAELQNRRNNSVIFIVLQFKQNYFGILVDKIDGTEEIVVKRLPNILQSRSVFAGTTILGSGKVSLILDINGMVEKSQLDYAHKQDSMFFNKQHVQADKQKIVIFTNAENEYFGIPVNLLSEVDRVSANELHQSGSREFIKRHNESIPILRLDRIIDVGPLPAKENYIVLIPSRVSYITGIIANRIVGTTELNEEINTKESNVKGVMGSVYYQGNMVLLLDIFSLLQTSDPKRYKNDIEDDLSSCRLLVVDDQLFFRQLVSQYFRAYGVKSIHIACDGQEALNYLYKHYENIDVVVSDIEMPVMNGYQLVANIKSSPQLQSIPVMALTTLSGEDNVRKGMEAGFDAYEVKIDKENVVRSLSKLYRNISRRQGG